MKEIGSSCPQSPERESRGKGERRDGCLEGAGMSAMAEFFRFSGEEYGQHDS